MISRYLKPSLNWLLVFVPAAYVLHYTFPDYAVSLFFVSCLSIVPLAGWMGEATEHIAEHTSESIGGLLNATFGNAAELIIALAALRRGNYEIAKASLTGSIIGNTLLVLGASFLAGGLKYKKQNFSPSVAASQSTMLTLAFIAMLAPYGYHYFSEGMPGRKLHEQEVSMLISIILLVIYALDVFAAVFSSRAKVSTPESGHEPHRTGWKLSTAIAVLVGCTVLVAWISEFLVGSVEVAAHRLGMSSVFVGVIVVAIVGNAAEHSTAIMMALKDKMEVSLSIAIGSSVQIALFVAPVLVLASYGLGSQGPMDLIFSPPEVLAVALAVVITKQIAGDGESNWLEGAQLLAVYLIIAILFYFLPEPALAH